MGQRVKQIHKRLIDVVAIVKDKFKSEYTQKFVTAFGSLTSNYCSPRPVASLVRGEGDPVGGAVCSPVLVAAGHSVASTRAHTPGLGPRHPVRCGVTRERTIKK